jgi:hypothetical protein
MLDHEPLSNQTREVPSFWIGDLSPGTAIYIRHPFMQSTYFAPLSAKPTADRRTNVFLSSLFIDIYYLP